MTMRKSNRNVAKILLSGLLILELLLVGSCDSWMSNDDFMEQIESEVHDANAAPINVYVRYANAKMGTTEPQGSTTMKVDVASKISAVTNDDYGFVRWAAFSTEDFATDKQHSKLTYISEEDYNENYKSKELSSEIVYFSDPKNPATDVKILAERNDIFIIPIVATRPSYVQSVPGAGDSNIVKNTSIRILFSKPINTDTIKDTEGNLNFNISTSAAVFTDDDKEMEANDITEYFDYSFSESKKMLTLKLKDNQLLDNRQYITVTLLEGLEDLYGFSMNGNYTFKFQTGTSTDSLAPMIEVIYGGTGDICNVFVTFGEDGKSIGTATNEAKNAPKEIDSEKYTSAVIAQRVYDKLNIFVKANDIINSGNADINPAKDLSEDNVALIYISAGLYIDANGNPITIDESNSTTYQIGKKSYTYISGTIDQNANISKQFTDMVPVDKDGNKYSSGMIYSYDVSNLPDGLIRIDVWAGDMTGNAGGPDDKGAPYYEKHDNGFKSIFVVKDTTPIDSSYVKANKQVISNSALAPYFWYNNSSLGSMELFDSPSNKIHDAGHEKLRALDKNLWWTFKVGNVTEKISKDDSTWKRIHDETDGTTSLHYNLANATAPSVDGPVDITLYLKDDMGNLSEPVLLDSIMYDNTAPSVSLKSGKGDFVNEAGNEELHASDPKVIEQILKVTIAESNENNTGSGIRRMEIHVKKGNEEVEAPLDATTFKVLYAPSSIENPTPSSEGIRPITVQTAEADSATTNTVKVFNVTDADKITDGTLFIYGLTLGDTDGTYEVNVDLFDSALNKTPVTAVTRIARDTTEPVINKVQVLGAQARKVYGQDEETWWMPYDKFEDANNLTKVTLRVSANESGSGLKYIKLADNAEFTENTVLYVGDKALVRDVDYSLDIANKIIELKDWYTPLFINPTNGEHIITLENIKLNNLNAPAGTTQGNKILLTLDDFVDKSKSNENQIYYGETASTGTLVYADSIAPQIAYLHIADSAKHTANNPDDKGYNGDNYTDSQNVVLTLTFGDTEAGNKGSGVNQVILSDNAEFTSGTQIYYRNEDGTETLLAQSTDYEITSDTVNFKKVFTETDTLKFTNVKLVSDVQGEQSIKADVKDFVGIKSTESEPANVLIYDSVNPELYEAYWVAENNTVTAGTCNSEVINNQTLRIEFTEVTSGVKVIQLDITQDGIANDTPYATPFDSITQLTYEYNGTENLVKDVDYTVQGKYIVLNKTYTSGAFNIKGITLKNTVDQASYNVNITLLDASENKHAKATGIAIDTIAPEFTESLRVPALKRTVELTASGTTAAVDGYWLDANHVNGRNKAADSIPVYIKIREKSSGIKVITFAANAVISEATTLWLVNGTNETEVDASKYTRDLANNTITINEEADARALFRRADDSVFELLVKNVGLNQPDTETSASNNTIKMFLSDVAKNQNPDGMVQATPSIYSDSRAPNAPTALTLKDRKTTTTTIAASDGYTNESIVDMTFNLDNSEQFGSGYHKFVLSGATFIQNGADKTTLTLKDTAGNVVPNVEFDITDNNTTLILKRTNQTADTYTVVRQAVSVELKNVELANPTANENHTVSVTAYDLTGRNAEAVSTSIILDTQVPTVAPVFTAAYTKEGSAYDASLNVYPHPNGENGTGVTRTFGDKSIPTFYTKAKVDENESSYNAVLGIHASDNICLGGNVRPTTFLYYVNDESFNMTLAQIIASNTKVNPETGINGNRANQTCLWFKFPVGKYSAVIADEAGNISSVFRFNVEADDTAPAVTDFAEHVLFERPNADSDVYRNTIAASTGSGEFTYTSNESIGKLFMSRKYVTKKSGDKYRIVLNLGGAYTSNNTSAIVKKLDGADATDALNYAELSADVNRAPIEKYAIVTTYTDWAASSQDTSNYVPVIPGLTDALWHNYTAGGQQVTDEANNIVSFVDSNNNLVIELPNTQSTAPVTVFVRDGCGNYSHVLLGYDSTSKTAVSYIVDGKLGTKAANDGVIEEPVIIQYPYLTSTTSTSGTFTWTDLDVSTNSTNYVKNSQSGNAEGSDNGKGQTRGFIKDFVKKATYYNPNITPFKLGLLLKVNANNQETVLFGDNNIGKTTSSTDYTVRAKLYCTTDESVPTRDKFESDATSTGYHTDWVNVRSNQGDNKDILIVLDYPIPDYSTLGWTTNETNGEPKPYFIWYLFEDRVGNYEIAKVVNSAGSGTQLNQAYSADSSVFDRWLYDNEAPKLTIRGTTTDPGTITAADINTLVATNNGFVPYVKKDSSGNIITDSNGKATVYVHASLTHSDLQDGATKNTNLGNGTTHTVDGGSYSPYSPYNPFMDLAVSEITGVRAFAWSNSENIDFGNSYTDNSYWYNGSTVYWYVGWGSVSDSGGLEKDIGKGTFGYSSYAGNAYFDTSISSSYSGKYSGTKVNTYIPYGKLSTTAEKELWLHVMDWTGNISHYRMGQNLKFVNDSTVPDYSSTTTGEKLEPNQYYMKKTSDSSIPLVRFAGTGADALAQNNINVYLPENYFTEAGSGVQGYSFKNDGTGIATDGLYLSIPYSKYSASTTQSSMTYYVYDNVGNRAEKTLYYVFDTDAPAIKAVSIRENSGISSSFKFCDPEHGLATNEDNLTGFNYYRDYTFKDVNGTTLTKPINKPHDNVDNFETGELQEVYFNGTGMARFHVILEEACSDIKEIQVNRWKNGSWVTYTGYKRDSAADDTTWKAFGEAITSTTRDDYWTGNSESDTFVMVDFNLTYTKEGTYYQILATDISGNSSFRYFKLYLDNEAPIFAENQYGEKRPVVTPAIGSINPITVSGTTTYYYNANSSNYLKINFAVEDSGSGSKSSLKQFQYSLNNSNWYDITNSTKELSFDSSTIETIYLRDILGNTTTASLAKPGFSYHYTDASGVPKTVTIPKLVKYTGSAPAAPAITAEDINYIDKDYKTKRTSIVNEIQTKGLGEKLTTYNNNTGKWNTQSLSQDDWSHLYTEKLNIAGSNTILIKQNESSPERKQLKISFTPASNYIIGYLELGENETPSTVVGAYSFADTANMKSFISDLPMKEDYGLATKKYYAVDVVGNISDPLTITYSYNNPHSAKNIKLIKNPDEINSTIKAKMVSDGIIFARYLDVEGSPKDTGWKTGRRYISDGYIVVSFTLPEKLDSENSYSETPERIQLIDKWGNTTDKQKLRGEIKNTSSLFKLYSETTKNSDERYNWYIAFKLDISEEEKGNGSNGTQQKPAFNGQFYNNKDKDGSVIYAKIFGSTSESELTALNETEKATYGWMIDNKAPEINSNYYDNDGNEKLIHTKKDNKNAEKFILGTSPTSYTVSISKAIGNNGSKENLYDANSIAYLKVNFDSSKTACLSDNFTTDNAIKYKFVVAAADNFTANVSPDDSDWVSLITDETSNGYQSVNGAGYWRFVLPNISEPNNKVALFLKDEVGNVSDPYYLADQQNGQWIKTWIVDKGPESATITEDGKTTLPSYSETATSYVLNVAMNKGAIIKSISAVNAEVESVEFNDESGSAWTSQPSYDSNTGKFANDDSFINLKSIKVTLKNLNAPIWNETQAVKLKINGSEIGGTVITIPVKKLSEGDITLKQIVEDQEQDLPIRIDDRIEDNAEKTVRIKFAEGANGSRLAKIAVSGAKIKINNSKYDSIIPASTSWGDSDTTIDLTLTDIEQSWTGDSSVKLTFTPTVATGQTATTFEKAVFTVGKKPLQESDITFTLPTSFVNGAENTIKLETAKANITDSTVKERIKKVTLVDGNTENELSPASSTTTSYTYKKKIYKDWVSKSVKLRIYDTLDGNVIEKPVFSAEVPAIDSTDISVTGPASYTNGTEEYEYEISIPGITLVEFDITHDGDDGFTWTPASDTTYAKAKITAKRGWSDKTVTLKVKNFTVKTLNISAPTATEITEGVTGLSAYSNDTKIYGYTISIDGITLIADDITYSGVSASDYTFTAADETNPAKVTMVIERDWEAAKTITLSINGKEVRNFNVSKIDASEISVNGPESYDSNTTTYTYEISVPGYTLKEEDVTATGANGLTFMAATETEPAKANLTVNQEWNEKTVTLKVRDNPKISFDVAAKELTKKDITITNGDWESKEIPVTFNNGASRSAIDSITISLSDGTNTTPLTNVSWSWKDENTDTLVLTGEFPEKGWKTQDISLTIKNKAGNDLEPMHGMTIPVKVLGEGDILFTPASWTSGETANYEIAVSFPTGASKANVKSLAVEGATDLEAAFNEDGDKIILTGTNPTQTWDSQSITITVYNTNNEAVATMPALNVPAKTFDANCVEVPVQTWPEDGKWTQASFNIKSELPITNVISKDTSKFKVTVNSKWNENKEASLNLALAEGVTSITKADLVIQVQTEKGNADIALFPSGPGASNNNQRSIFGFRTKGNTYSATSTSSSSAGEAPKTRSVSLRSWVNDVFNGGSDAAVEAVKDEVKSSAKKASKKSKKSAKAAKSQKVVEKSVVAENAEVAAVSLAETSAATVNEAVGIVAATVSAATEVVEEAAPAVDGVSASLEAEAAAPLSAEPDLPDASVESPSASVAAIIMAIAALCAAAAALTIIALKKRAAKK